MQQKEDIKILVWIEDPAYQLIVTYYFTSQETYFCGLNISATSHSHRQHTDIMVLSHDLIMPAKEDWLKYSNYKNKFLERQRQRGERGEIESEREQERERA